MKCLKNLNKNYIYKYLLLC
uniref:Uncharacterized protein n=1 Tax=Anguilla anguilla TaxID=7936 RepID=A0A0E9XXL3_ANGAN